MVKSEKFSAFSCVFLLFHAREVMFILTFILKILKLGYFIKKVLTKHFLNDKIGWYLWEWVSYAYF